MKHGYIAIGLFTVSLGTSLSAAAMSEQAFQARAAEVFKPLMATYDVPAWPLA